ncbi:Atg16p KNAG_0I00880 [Huiozyma naganishii CBS 8797]|uniref:Autophagy-related protein 16 domain-containing protein n=1 Tax=Huiozyma naganishii (strain ATCC MYA-139 / BCRC 22969 / CBS 8797 / KCTC 17520 / NBRC 10181 / NCYC 3082 / Yp74L-3) TaxID=1071383 RepID=J7S928_HUIN7|nr:hypothetical protein KNAG_0I00880 [Kazachstania naganishii CBS 8797]CCK71879.1 hypothetical protein KNAG_0I00880 [Kazachstania naganishii CBS 8797]
MERYERALVDRDRAEQLHSELFPAVADGGLSLGPEIGSSRDEETTSLLPQMRQLLAQRDTTISQLKEERATHMSQQVHLNDVILGLTLERNVMEDKLKVLQREYKELVTRWLAKAQQEADSMNRDVEQHR